MAKLSVLITTNNEEANLPALLENLGWVDEIIVVDSFSTDNTPQLAQREKVRFYQRAYKGPADQKNWGLGKVSHDWVLILDADERVPKDLKLEVMQTISQKDEQKDAYWIYRRNFFGKKEIRFSGWQKDKVIRLVKNHCRYNDLQAHEEIDQENIRVGYLSKRMDHHTFKDGDHFLNKHLRYAKWSAEDHLSKTNKVGFFHLWLKPAFRFYKHYFLQLGILDGKEGFMIAKTNAMVVFLRYYYIWSRRNLNN